MYINTKCPIVKLPNGNTIDCVKDFKKYFIKPIYEKRYDIDKIENNTCLCCIDIYGTLQKYNVIFTTNDNNINIVTMPAQNN